VNVPERVGLCMLVRACSLANSACIAYAPYCDIILIPLDLSKFSTFSHKRRDFLRKLVEYKIFILILSATILSNIFLFTRKI
jgi:hypothetical protein